MVNSPSLNPSNPPKPSNTQNFSRSVTIERKIFTVDHRGTTLRLTEQRGKHKSYVLFPAELGCWIADQCSAAAGLKDGFINKEMKGEVTVIITRKTNTSGCSLSLMFSSPKIKQGLKYIICPQGPSSAGWTNLGDCLRLVAMHALQTPSTSEVAHPRPDPPRGERNSGKEKRGKRKKKKKEKVDCKKVLMKISEGECELNNIPHLLLKVLKLEGLPSIQPMENSQHQLLNMHSGEDAQRLGEICHLKLKACSLEFERFQTAVVDPANPPWARIRRRIVRLWGVPLEARDDAFLAEFSRSFGTLEYFEEEQKVVAGLTVVKLILKDVDLSAMKQVKPLRIGDREWSIRLIPGREVVSSVSLEEDDVANSGRTETHAMIAWTDTAETDNRALVETVQGTPDKTTDGTNSSVQRVASGTPSSARIPAKSIVLPLTPTQIASGFAIGSEKDGCVVPSGLASGPSFAEVVKHSKKQQGQAGASSPSAASLIRGKRITDLNSSPIDSDDSAPCLTPQIAQTQSFEDIIARLVRLGDLLGYDDQEKQSMVNTTLDSLSKECRRLEKEKEKA